MLDMSEGHEKIISRPDRIYYYDTILNKMFFTFLRHTMKMENILEILCALFE